MENRKRSKDWKTRLTEEEYQNLKDEIEKLGIHLSGVRRTGTVP